MFADIIIKFIAGTPTINSKSIPSAFKTIELLYTWFAFIPTFRAVILVMKSPFWANTSLIN
jgi:hypothetical protein